MPVRGNNSTLRIGGKILQPGFKPNVVLQCPVFCKKIIFYATDNFSIVRVIHRYTAACILYREEIFSVEKGLSVLCLCWDHTRDNDKDVLFLIPINTNVRLMVLPQIEPEIFSLFCYEMTTFSLQTLCSANLAIQFRTKTEWEQLFKVTFSTHRTIKHSIVRYLVHSELQRKLIFFNLYAKNNNACFSPLNYAGHTVSLSPHDAKANALLNCIDYRRSREVVNYRFEKYSNEWYAVRRLKYQPRKNYRLVYFAYTI